MEKEKIQQKIDIYCIFRDVLRDLWVAVIIGISIAFIAYIGGKLSYQASYTSQTTFVVSAKENGVGAYENMSKTQKLTEIFQSVMDSQVLKKKVSEKLKLNGFPGTIDIAVVPETNLLTVSVTSDTPDMAFRLLKAMLECYPEIGEKVLGEVVLEVFEEPGYPFVANQYFYGEAIMKRAFMLGFICMIGILAIASCMKDTVKNEQDVSQKLDTTVFGVLQHERKYRNLKDFLRRKKKKIFVTEPTLSFGYVETIKRIRTKLLYQTEKSGAKVILVTSAMPGEGKTTVAMNLAQVLSQRSKKVLLIEGNLRVPGLAHRMRLEGEKLPSWGQFFRSGSELRDAIIQPEGYGYQVMVNGTKIVRSTELLASRKMDEFMREMRQEMDVIIIDAPHVQKRSDTEVLARISDSSLLVVKQNYTLAKYINDAVDMLNGYGYGLLGCIFNDVLNGSRVLSSAYGYGYGYGKYVQYGKYGRYGHYGVYQETTKKESENE